MKTIASMNQKKPQPPTLSKTNDQNINYEMNLPDVHKMFEAIIWVVHTGATMLQFDVALRGAAAAGLRSQQVGTRASKALTHLVILCCEGYKSTRGVKTMVDKTKKKIKNHREGQEKQDKKTKVSEQEKKIY